MYVQPVIYMFVFLSYYSVNKRFYELIQHPALWRKVKLNVYLTSETDPGNEVFRKTTSLTNTVDITFINPGPERCHISCITIVNMMASCSKTMETFKIKNVQMDTSLENVMYILSNAFQNVSVVYLNNSMFEPLSESRVFQNTKLTYLNLVGCKYENKQFLNLNCFPNIQALDFSQTDTPDVWFLNVNIFEFLNVINVGHTWLTGISLPHLISCCKNAKEIYLCWLYFEDRHILESEVLFPKVEILCICGAVITVPVINRIFNLCPNLRLLYLDVTHYAQFMNVSRNVYRNSIVREVRWDHTH